MTALEGKTLLDHGKAIARRYARRVGPELAEDIRGEAVLRALASPPPDGRIEPWLERIYRNLLVDSWRRQRTRTVDCDRIPTLASSGTPEDAVLHRECRRLVRASLRNLPREIRKAIVARYFCELDDGLAAGRLGVAVATIRTRIHRALARLRGRLAELRGFCPLFFGKLWTQTAAIGLAPVMVAALAIVGAPSPTPEPGPSTWWSSPSDTLPTAWCKPRPACWSRSTRWSRSCCSA
jgi:RNA polymerase sigma factor (sigma-70 family)